MNITVYHWLCARLISHLLTHMGYHSLALSHQYESICPILSWFPDLQKLWRSATVEGVDETKIEEYLEKQGITSLQDMAMRKPVSGTGMVFNLMPQCKTAVCFTYNFNSLAQDLISISIANALEIPQPCNMPSKYCKISNIGHTKFQNLNVSRLVLELSLPNPMKPGIKSIMKM